MTVSMEMKTMLTNDELNAINGGDRLAGTFQVLGGTTLVVGGTVAIVKSGGFATPAGKKAIGRGAGMIAAGGRELLNASTRSW